MGGGGKVKQSNRLKGSTQQKLEEKLQIDLDLLKFERQETDDMDEDDQEQVETERIDVKRDIALNDEMKNNQSSSTSS